MNNWEYDWYIFTTYPHKDRLNAWGDAGWELIQVIVDVKGWCCVFKRPIA